MSLDRIYLGTLCIANPELENKRTKLPGPKIDIVHIRLLRGSYSFYLYHESSLTIKLQTRYLSASCLMYAM